MAAFIAVVVASPVYLVYAMRAVHLPRYIDGLLSYGSITNTCQNSPSETMERYPLLQKILSIPPKKDAVSEKGAEHSRLGVHRTLSFK